MRTGEGQQLGHPRVAALFAVLVCHSPVIQLPPYHSRTALVLDRSEPPVSVEEEVPFAAPHCCCSTTSALAHSCVVQASALWSAAVLLAQLRVTAGEPARSSFPPELELAP